MNTNSLSAFGRPSANLVLTGFMGTGKSAVGREVAHRLGLEFVDMDETIEERSSMSISEIFSQHGESEFRNRESALCQELRGRHGLVIATGGGALLYAANRELMESNSLVVCLTCDEEALLRRLRESSDRPLLEGRDRVGEIRRLLAERRDAYQAMEAQLDTTGKTISDVATEVVNLWRAWLDQGVGSVSTGSSGIVSIPVAAPSYRYEIHLGSGALETLGDRIWKLAQRGKVALVSNPLVARLHAEQATESIHGVGMCSFNALIQDGEQHKTLHTVSTLYDRFLSEGLDRTGVVVALGGGVVGDVAGFAAASYMRGLPFVQVPTTLLSMVDSSVGGKTGVDLPAGKNLVGAFKHPASVVADPDVLRTLPACELRNGLAEMIKGAIIGDPELFDTLESRASAVGAALSNGDEERLWKTLDWPWAIECALKVKIRVVEQDPGEQGLRAVLNLGHTTAHALERLSNYGLPHGEAVSIGLVVACRLAVALGQAESLLPARVAAVLQGVGLPSELPTVDASDIVQAMQSDKKKSGQKLRWVLPRGIGDVVYGRRVPGEDVLAVLEAALAGPSQKADSRSRRV